MSRYAGLLIALLFSIPGLTQTIKGKVKDSTGGAVPYANVNLRDDHDHRILAYAVTDAGGAYVLQIPSGVSLNGLSLEVTSIGYKSQERSLSDLHLAYDFTLSVSANQLRAIEIKAADLCLGRMGIRLDIRCRNLPVPRI